MSDVNPYLFQKKYKDLTTEEKAEIRKIAATVYTPPFRYDGHGYIWDSKDNMVADNPVEEAFLRIRGWGHLQYLRKELEGTGAENNPGILQDIIGEMIADALTASFHAMGNDQPKDQAIGNNEEEL